MVSRWANYGWILNIVSYFFDFDKRNKKDFLYGYDKSGWKIFQSAVHWALVAGHIQRKTKWVASHLRTWKATNGSYKKHFCLKCTVSELWFFCHLTSYILQNICLVKDVCMKKTQTKENMTILLQKQENLSFLLEKWAKCVCGAWPAQKCSCSNTLHTFFKSLFARTPATAHRTCACAHAPSQPIPW